MVEGLQLFGQHFKAFSDQYVLIGGTACDLAFDRVGLDFRATKDLDIVLCVEALSRPFAQEFWSFVRAGGRRTMSLPFCNRFMGSEPRD
jgi:glutathionyl-hydroquinone reductase